MPELRLEHSLVDDRYEVRERLGLGSYAEIFVVRDREAENCEVVIKALNTSLQGTPDAELERTLVENLQNEAIALDAVRHPHVILRLGHGTAADLRGVPFHYLVLEYMPGGDLLQLCRRRPGNALTLPEALSYFRQVCEALAYAHEQGIIHRDLKPNNFLLDADHQTVKVADFGVAKLSAGDATEITRVGAGIYAPPEHHPDSDEVCGRVGRLTAAADIYSLAKSFYTVVCGRSPSQFTRRPIASLPDHVARAPWAGSLLAVLRRATADAVDERYATVVEFWSDLAAIASAGMYEEAIDEDVETRVRPKLRVEPGAIPASPELPSFAPVLASVGGVSFTTRGGRRVAEASELPDHHPPQQPRSVQPQPGQPPSVQPRPVQPKIVVPIGRPTPAVAAEPAPAPAAKTIDVPVAVPTAASTPAAATPAAVKPAAVKPALGEAAAAAADWRVRLRRSLTANLRRQIFIVLLAVAFLGLLASTYHFARSKAQPAEIEVVIDNLTVRTAPNARAVELGWIPKGSRHRVLGTAENGWLRVEIDQWNELRPHDQVQRQGWVNGDEKFVSIVQRRWW